MTPTAAMFCLLFAVQVQDEDRAGWKDKLRAIQPTWGRKELTAYLETVRFPVAHRPDVLHGGGFGTGSGLTFFEVYSLDQTTSLYVVWNSENSAKGIRSTEAVRFADLKDRVDAELFDAISAIQRSPSAQHGLGFAPVPLIRAVNALQALGKEKAVQALRAYCRFARALTAEERNKHVVDESRILPILRLLFPQPPGGMTEWGLGIPDVPPPPARLWPDYPLASPQDVPFMVVSGWQPATGRPKEAEDQLRVDPGPLRPEPLSPKVTPLEAADQLTQSEGWKALRLQAGDEGRKKWQIRRQALAAVSSVFSLLREESSNDCCVDPTEPQWRAAVDRAKGSGLIWSPEIQDFILGR